VLEKELDGRLDEGGHCFKWSEDLKSLQQIVIHNNGKSVAVRTQYIGTCGKVYQAMGVAIPSTIEEIYICQREICGAKNFFGISMWLTLQNFFSKLSKISLEETKTCKRRFIGLSARKE